jgi:hypothetical protein|uniref:Uncharacterized protein n=1 Tax=Picea glauca TaxID=3330 RepID=A0A101LW58_PICGL|nr:hypothetical protein ABT39_MTgene1575 [Picea glauca]QHR88355.1 hypothetical protein Q903MT_gene2368 [Picea sitchensis]
MHQDGVLPWIPIFRTGQHHTTLPSPSELTFYLLKPWSPAPSILHLIQIGSYSLELTSDSTSLCIEESSMVEGKIK